MKKGLYRWCIFVTFAKFFRMDFSELPSNCFCQQVQSLLINVEVSTKLTPWQRSSITFSFSISESNINAKLVSIEYFTINK